MKTTTYSALAAAAGLVLACTATPVLAQDAAAAAGVSPETKFVLNSVLFLVGGFLVMWMAAGFAMLEAGMVRSKNVATICTKNIGLYSIAGLMYWLVGYNLMYDGVDGGWIGSFTWYSHPAHEGEDVTKYAGASDWYFQMVFCATAASIVSGTLAERIKLWPFLVFVAVLTGVIYPIQGAWKWGEGWLHVAGFQDFAGSTLVHSAGGWAALVGALVLGARIGKYDKDGRINPLPGSSHAARHARHVHPVARLVRLQRRIAARARQPGRCVRRLPHLRQHQHGRRGRRGRGHAPDPGALRQGRPDHGAQRRARAASCRSPRNR